MNVTRDQIVLEDTYVLPDMHPLSQAGACLLAQNAGDEAVTLSVQESPNGTVWTTVLVSTPTSAGNASVEVAGLGFALLAFESTQAYVRLTCTERSTAGVFCSLVQYERVKVDTTGETEY